MQLSPAQVVSRALGQTSGGHSAFTAGPQGGAPAAARICLLQEPSLPLTTIILSCEKEQHRQISGNINLICATGEPEMKVLRT